VPAQIVSKFDVVVVWVHLGRDELPRATSVKRCPRSAWGSKERARRRVKLPC
jgi:hypothetical protein